MGGANPPSSPTFTAFRPAAAHRAHAHTAAGAAAAAAAQRAAVRGGKQRLQASAGIINANECHAY